MVDKKMQDYILSSKECAIKNIEQRKALVGRLAASFIQSNSKSLKIVASGSSYNAALCALPFMRKQMNIKIELVNPFSFIHYGLVKKDEYVLFISQSGYSTNIIDAAKHGAINGIITRCISGYTDSDLAKCCDEVYDFGLEEETVGYVTKGVILLTIYLDLFSIEVSERGKIVLKNMEDTGEDSIEKLICACSSMEEMAYRGKQLFDLNLKSFLSIQKLIICQAEEAKGCAMEVCLKFSELLRVPCIYCDPEEYLHGYYYQIDPSYTVFFIQDNVNGVNRVKNIAEATREVTDNVYCLFNQGDISLDCNDTMLSNLTDWELTSLVFLPFFQEIVYLAASKTNNEQLHPLAVNMKKHVQAKTDNYRKGERK